MGVSKNDRVRGVGLGFDREMNQGDKNIINEIARMKKQARPGS